MGWRDFIPDSVEDKVEHGIEKVGDFVEWSGDKVADLAEEAGLDDAGDWIRDKSRSAANQLGAEVSELELGQTDDPKKLVYGSVSKIREQVGHLNDFKKAFESVGNGLKAMGEPDGLKGEAAKAFRESVAKEPPRWFNAAKAFGEAADAMGRFAETVEWAQGKAKEALEDYNKAKKASADARDAYNKAAEAYNDAYKANKDPLPPKPNKDYPDPGKAMATAAQDKLDNARKQRNEQAETVAAAVRKARDAAPPKPSYTKQLGDGLDYIDLASTHLVGGVVKGTAGIVNFARALNPTDPYNLTHPAEYLTNLNSTAAGLVTMANDPWGAGKQMLDEFMKDPSEGVGKLLPELVGSKGLGSLKKVGSAAKHLDDIKHKPPRTSLAEDGPGPHSTPDALKTSEHTDPIDLATGRMYLAQTDVEIPGALPLVFTRRADSGYRAGRWFGPTWASTVDQRLEVDAEGVVLVSEDGLLLAFPHPAPGVPVTPVAGARVSLARTPDGDYCLTDPGTGLVRRFSPPAGDGDGIAPISQLEDRNGNFITFEYDEYGTPLAMAHSAGERLHFDTAGDRIVALHLTGGPRLRTYGYAEGYLASVADSSGRPLRFECDERGRITSWTDTNDRRYEYVYDERDRCIAEGGAAGHMALTLEYDTVDAATGHRVTTVTTGAGHTRRYLVDADSRIVARIDELGAVTRLAYDRYGQLLEEVDPLGLAIRHTYDERGLLVSAVRQDGREWRAEYNELGLPVRVVRPDGSVVRQTYDERGNRTSVTGTGGGTTQFTHDARGHLVSVTNALGDTSYVRCDAAGRVLETVEPLGATTTYERDAFGRTTAVTDPLGRSTRLTWSVEGHLLHRAAPDGSEESWTYDAEGNCLTHTDALGGVTSYEYGHFDLLVARTDPDGVRHTFDYDADLRLTEVTNPQGLKWTYAYDAAGNLVEERDFDSRPLHYAYDAAGRLASRTDALGLTTAFERNALGQVVRKDAAGLVTTFEYDVSDQLVSAVSPDASIVWLRDRAGLLRSETVNGRTTTYDYDVLGRRTHRTTPTGVRSRWTYDATGRRSALTVAGRTVDFERDAVGRELTRHVGALSLSHAYDEAGRVVGQRVAERGGATLRQRSYRYRADGMLSQISSSGPGGDRTFTLDAVGRITGVDAAGWTERYAYDEAGNQTAASWPDEHPGGPSRGERAYTGTRVSRAGGVRYEYDALGRVVLRQKTRLSRKPDTWRYAWDAEDRLVRVTTPDGVVWRYLYDALGRRTAKQRLGSDGETVVEQVDFVWDGTTLCEQTTRATGSAHAITLTWDHNGLRPLTQTERLHPADAPQEVIDERFFSIVTDLVGAPTELVDESGALSWQGRSTVWGSTTWPVGSTAHTPLRFPGQYHDPESGFHYNVNRHYDPETARYASPDPLGLKAAPNPVAYVVNPYRELDPLGLTPYKVLYHGTPEWKGNEFSLDPDINTKRQYTPDAGVYLTDDFSRAATQYAGPQGTVVRVEVPPDFAESVYRLHSGPAGNLPEYFVNTPEGVELLNKHLKALPQGQAIMEHFTGKF